MDKAVVCVAGKSGLFVAAYVVPRLKAIPTGAVFRRDDKLQFSAAVHEGDKAVRGDGFFSPETGEAVNVCGRSVLALIFYLPVFALPKS